MKLGQRVAVKNNYAWITEIKDNGRIRVIFKKPTIQDILNYKKESEKTKRGEFGFIPGLLLNRFDSGGL